MNRGLPDVAEVWSQKRYAHSGFLELSGSALCQDLYDLVEIHPLKAHFRLENFSRQKEVHSAYPCMLLVTIIYL